MDYMESMERDVELLNALRQEWKNCPAVYDLLGKVADEMSNVYDNDGVDYMIEEDKWGVLGLVKRPE